MSSIVLYGDRKKYNCSTCMDGSNFTAQGRNQEYADERIKRKLASKGCIENAKGEVIRISLNDRGHKIFRCPRALSDDSGAVSHYSEYISNRDGGIRFHGSEYPFKWHKVMASIRNEIAKVEKAKREQEGRKSQQHPPRARSRRG